MPAIVITIIGLIQAAIKWAPTAIEVVKRAKETIDMLFTSKMITAEQQDRLHAHVDAICEAVESGETPPEFTVEPDPQ